MRLYDRICQGDKSRLRIEDDRDIGRETDSTSRPERRYASVIGVECIVDSAPAGSSVDAAAVDSVVDAAAVGALVVAAARQRANIGSISNLVLSDVSSEVNAKRRNGGGHRY